MIGSRWINAGPILIKVFFSQSTYFLKEYKVLAEQREPLKEFDPVCSIHQSPNDLVIGLQEHILVRIISRWNQIYLSFAMNNLDITSMSINKW